MVGSDGGSGGASFNDASSSAKGTALSLRENSTIYRAIDPDFHEWKDSLTSKLYCKALRKAMVYFYHSRRAAGTSVREAIKVSTSLSMISLAETEGVLVNESILSEPGVISVITLRDPIARVLSLYWYEHVWWHAGTLRQPQRCKTLDDWVVAWSSEGHLRKAALRENPKNNYIELENYYVKLLSNWDGHSVVTGEHLSKAKATLRKFDLVFISEWLGDETEIDAFNAVFRGRQQISVGHKASGNRNQREKLTPLLAPNEAQVKEKLTQRNHLDVELYDYAQSLVALRLKEVVSMTDTARELAKQSRLLQSDPLSPSSASIAAALPSSACLADPVQALQRHRDALGIFRPPSPNGP